MKQELFDIVKSSSLAHGMTEADVRALLASSKVQRRTLAKGGIVFHEGDVPRGLYLLLSGTLVIKKDTFSGRQIFLSDVSTPGEMFGEVYEVLEIASSLFSLAGGDLSRPALCVQRSLMRTFAQKAYYMHGRIQVLASGTLREKIVRFLADHLAADGTAQLAESR